MTTLPSPVEGGRGVEWRSWMDGPLGTKTLSFLPGLAISGGSVSYTSRVMHLYCGIVVVIIIHRHKLSLPAERDRRLQYSWQKRKRGWYQLPIPALKIVVGYVHLWPPRVEGWHLFGSWIPKASYNIFVCNGKASLNIFIAFSPEECGFLVTHKLATSDVMCPQSSLISHHTLLFV